LTEKTKLEEDLERLKKSRKKRDWYLYFLFILLGLAVFLLIKVERKLFNTEQTLKYLKLKNERLEREIEDLRLDLKRCKSSEYSGG
jgi:cell division protein FtsB